MTLYSSFIVYSKPIIYIIAFLIIIIFAYYAYKSFYKDTFKDKVFSDIANANTNQEPIDIYFFHVDWCPHCKYAQPEWNAFVDEYDGKNIGNYTIRCNDINCTDEDDVDVTTYISQYGINSYPTLKLVKDNTQYDFQSKITKQTMEKFVDNMTS